MLRIQQRSKINYLTGVAFSRLGYISGLFPTNCHILTKNITPNLVNCEELTSIPVLNAYPAKTFSFLIYLKFMAK